MFIFFNQTDKNKLFTINLETLLRFYTDIRFGDMFYNVIRLKKFTFNYKKMFALYN